MSTSSADEEPNGLASMVADLVDQNLVRDPRRRRLLRPAVVALTATDAGVGATIRISRVGVEVANGADARAHLEVAADAHQLLDLVTVPLRLGVPDVCTVRGREVVWALLEGRLRVRGLLRHPLRLVRLNRLLSAGGVGAGSG